MPSSKLSNRRDAALKPPICKSIPPALPRIPWMTNTLLTFEWILPPYPPTLVAETVSFSQPPGTTDLYWWDNASPATPRIANCKIIIPPDGSLASARMVAIDQNGSQRIVETDFPNPGPPPNAFSIFAWNYQTDPADIASIENPV